MTLFRTVFGVALLAFATSAFDCRQTDEPVEPVPRDGESDTAFDSPQQALRYFDHVRTIFPDAGAPADLPDYWLAADLPPADEDGEEEEEDPGPASVPPPPGVDPKAWRVAARSANWAGIPKGGPGQCPCETDYIPAANVVHFNADPRRPNPPNPDPGNGLFPAIWRNCLAPIQAPQGAPDHECAPPCRWRTTRIDDWILFNTAAGQWRLTCYKLLVFHCDLDSLPPGELTSRAELGRGVPVL